MEGAVTEYGLTQAAARAGLDARGFRVLADKSVVLATPETRIAPRGKARMYSTDEIVIARIVGDLMKFGMTTTTLAGLADWIRSHSGRFFNEAREGAPIYIRLNLTTPDNWSGDITKARNIDKPGQQAIEVYDPRYNDVLANRLLIINLESVIQDVEYDWLAWWKGHTKPSELLKTIQESGRECLKLDYHTDKEVDAFLSQAEQAAATGDVWPVADKAE